MTAYHILFFIRYTIPDSQNLGLKIILSIFMLMPLFVIAQNTSLNSADELVRVEVNFASMASKKGISVAFLNNLSADGIVTQGNKLVNGIKAYGGATDSPDELLSWRPEYAFGNLNHDFGFTSGPYLYYPKKGAKPLASGFYFSIWSKDSSGTYRVKFDGGVNHSKVREDYIGLMQKELPSTIYQSAKSKNIDSFIHTLEIFEKAISNPLEAYKKYLAKNCLLLRPDEEMYKSQKEFMTKSQSLHSTKFKHIQQGSGHDSTKSIYYTYGNLQDLNQEIKEGKFQGFYVRVWQNQNKEWKIIADVQQYAVK